MANWTRRHAMQSTWTGIATAMLAGVTRSVAAQEVPAGETGFDLRLAPHFGTFDGRQRSGGRTEMKFAADRGFSAWEDNGMKGRSVQEQTQRLGDD